MIRVRLILIAVILFSLTVLAERTTLKPGTKSPAQNDIELGLEVSREAEKELVLIHNSDATAYIATLGKTLVSRAPNDSKFPFTFKIVDDKAINAFALPGGPVYVNRGAIEAADNEAQIAGVIGHEIGHVILRHGMAQYEKSQKISLIPSLVGAVFGNSDAGKIAAGATAIGANMTILRYSRDAESEADLMGTQLLYDAGYDPTAIALFFDKLAKEHKGSKTEQWFSNHPIPENRVGKVKDEIKRLGVVSLIARKDTDAFQRVKKLLLAMPEPPKPKPADAKALITAAPPAPSSRMSDFQAAGVQLRYPDNWKPSVQGTNITLNPPGGVNDKGDLAYGMLIDVFKPSNASSLDEATAQFIDGIRMGNPELKLVRSKIQAQVGGLPAQLTELSNVSPAGGQESDFLYTVLRPNNTLQFIVQVVPTRDTAQYQNTFRAILDSLHFR